MRTGDMLDTTSAWLCVSRLEWIRDVSEPSESLSKTCGHGRGNRHLCEHPQVFLGNILHIFDLALRDTVAITGATVQDLPSDFADPVREV